LDENARFQVKERKTKRDAAKFKMMMEDRGLLTLRLQPIGVPLSNEWQEQEAFVLQGNL
jgi:hypothetical protein